MKRRWPHWWHTPSADPAAVNLAAAAREEAQHRRSATIEVLRMRDDVKRRNHIADDIGRAYRIIHGKG